MANRHFAKIADVWKHLPVVEVLSIERPSRYWESHAGSAVYEMVDDAERRYGALQFFRAAPGLPALARSRYLAHLDRMAGPAGRLASYPGSPMLVALELGPACAYLFCDLDPGSVANIRAAARRLDLESQVRVLGTDGMAGLEGAVHEPGPGGTTLAHIDPYDPLAVGPSGLSALGLARELIDRGIGVVYWYGYDQPEGREWAFDELAQRTPSTVWSGDVMVTAAGGVSRGGDLGLATTPGTGFGVVLANVSAPAIDACQRLGEALVAAYDGVPLPDGRPGQLDFASRAGDP